MISCFKKYNNKIKKIMISCFKKYNKKKKNDKFLIWNYLNQRYTIANFTPGRPVGSILTTIGHLYLFLTN